MLARLTGLLSDHQTGRRVLQLLRIELHDELFLRCDRDARAGGLLEHAAAERVLVDRDPGERRATRRLIHGREDRDLLARLHAKAYFLSGHDVEARNIDARLVHFDVTVTDELTGSLAAGREAHAIHDVVETRLEGRQQVVAAEARLRAHLVERVAELLLAHAINALDLLL